MQLSTFKTSRHFSGLTASVLLLAGHASLAQTVNLSAARTSTILPDGQTVPMWGYQCGTFSGATCAAANPNAGTGWSPVVITVPYTPGGPTLTINFVNNLSFPAGTGTNTVPTSLVIVGQLGGGLGAGGTTAASPVHTLQGVTWPTPGAADLGANSITV
ncbi:MAG: hypothetical protein QOD56_2752, partial [Gammaproteobacteria bacterium]|nr:hypothetical protein [Gammaproteobacteria bacterium]